MDVVEVGVELLRGCAGADDWVHLDTATLLEPGMVHRFSRALADSEATVSARIALPAEPCEPEQYWEDVEEVLGLVGGGGGLVALSREDLAWLYGGGSDSLEHDGIDAREVVAEWAAAHGLALVLLLGCRHCVVKPDGRVVEAAASSTRLDGGLGDAERAAAFVAHYVEDPQDLEACLAAAESAAPGVVPVPGAPGGRPAAGPVACAAGEPRPEAADGSPVH